MTDLTAKFVPKFEPRDPDFKSKVTNSFDRQKAMHTLGIHIVDLQPGYIELEMPFNEAYAQQHGFVHGVI